MRTCPKCGVYMPSYYCRHCGYEPKSKKGIK